MTIIDISKKVSDRLGNHTQLVLVDDNTILEASSNGDISLVVLPSRQMP